MGCFKELPSEDSCCQNDSSDIYFGQRAEAPSGKLIREPTPVPHGLQHHKLPTLLTKVRNVARAEANACSSIAMKDLTLAHGEKLKTKSKCLVLGHLRKAQIGT